MKYYVIACFVVLAGIVAVVLSQNDPVTDADLEHYASKRHIAEVETKVRPPSFEAMKYKPEVELRAPASETKK